MKRQTLEWGSLEWAMMDVSEDSGPVPCNFQTAPGWKILFGTDSYGRWERNEQFADVPAELWDAIEESMYSKRFCLEDYIEEFINDDYDVRVLFCREKNVPKIIKVLEKYMEENFLPRKGGLS
jgi:hypothetical protein